MMLDKEQATFRRELPSLLGVGRDGKYALVHQEQVAGTYDTYLEAVEAGYQQFELEPFLVKRIEAVEEPKVVSRHIRPCLI